MLRLHNNRSEIKVKCSRKLFSSNFFRSLVNQPMLLKNVFWLAGTTCFNSGGRVCSDVEHSLFEKYLNNQSFIVKKSISN